MTDQTVNQVSQQNVDDVRVIEGLQAVRIMPGMYVGGTDIRALHHLVYEVVDNSLDEIMAGRGDRVIVTIHDDGSLSVSDNGGGIPVGLQAQKGVSALQVVMTNLHAGSKFNDGTTKTAYKVSGGLHGVGVSAVNALSAMMEATVWREGKVWRQVYEAGVPVSDVEPIRAMEADEHTGTTVRFIPDFTVMDPNEFSFDILAQRFREMAYVLRGAVITLIDERVKPIAREMTFYFEGGVRSFVRYLNRNREVVHEVVGGVKTVRYSEGTPTEGEMEVEFGFQYTDGTSSSTELSFANHINTPDGGTHQTGLRTALTRIINVYARKQGLLKEKDANFSGRDTLEGLTAIVSVKIPKPQFESQTKGRLINPEVAGAVASVVSDVFTEFLEMNPRDARKIVEKCSNSMRIRDALEKQRDLLTGRKGLLENTTLPGKLADCSDRDPTRTEVFIVEGDSAGGCFVGETMVSLASGLQKSMKELAEDWQNGIHHFGYASNDEGDIRIVPLIAPRLTRQQAALVEVILDNGEKLRCTPDHLFRLQDGTYKAAADLQSGESLMPVAIVQELVAEPAGSVVAQASMQPPYAVAYNVPPDTGRTVFSTESVSSRADVYDLTVEHYHNFALASGVFVHNSAKQGRDRHFQAILPLRGKILNTERARLNKILENNEIKALIAALGVGIGDDFNLSRLRYNRVVMMSVAGDEPTLVMHQSGAVEMVRIGEFIDSCLVGQRDPDEYQVMAFDLKTHETRFRPLKAVICHPHSEPMYRLTTRYQRSVKVTSSHSVFVLEEGQLKLKKGSEIHPGDTLVASRRLPRALVNAEANQQFDSAIASMASSNVNSLYSGSAHYGATAEMIAPVEYDLNPHDRLVDYGSIPGDIFGWSEAQQEAFLKDYFIVNGSISEREISVTVDSIDTRDALLYLLGQQGILATWSMNPTSIYEIAISGRVQLAACEPIWAAHPQAWQLDNYLAESSAETSDYTPISDDLIGLKVLSAEQIEPVGEYVYDFSVQDDENFICGIGGLCAHNTDADQDGAHIRTLLMTFFFRYMQPVIQEGHLYIAQPPIFRLEYKKQGTYFYPEPGINENDLLAKSLANYSDPQKVTVSRYKGLGEMNPQQLWETTMDPAHRTLLQVGIEDAAEADQIFSTLMGNEVAPRRWFITTHAKAAKLDV